MARLGSLALDDSLPRYGVSIKINGGPVTGTRLSSSARKKWSKGVNIVVMECYYRSNPIDENGVPLKGYRQRMYRDWLERGPFGDATE